MKKKVFKPPLNWNIFYDLILQMREKEKAPVDTMGCHMIADRSAPKEHQRYQSLLALMLSSQTRDQCTNAAMNTLKNLGCSPENLYKTTEDTIREAIVPVSFPNNKAKYIKQVTSIIVDKYGGKVPRTYEELVAMPGLGPKMVHLFMQFTEGVNTGIAVDTHVHRLSQRYEWVPPDVKSPEDTRKALESWLPKELWPEININFVGFGQTRCSAKSPKCSDCLANTICPYYHKHQPLSKDEKRKDKNKNVSKEKKNNEEINKFGKKRKRLEIKKIKDVEDLVIAPKYIRKKVK